MYYLGQKTRTMDQDMTQAEARMMEWRRRILLMLNKLHQVSGTCFEFCAICWWMSIWNLICISEDAVAKLQGWKFVSWDIDEGRRVYSPPEYPSVRVAPTIRRFWVNLNSGRQSGIEWRYSDICLTISWVRHYLKRLFPIAVRWLVQDVSTEDISGPISTWSRI